ncbi:MAG: GGDEF domain-containing protein [Candidatus Sumerlaeaceae bacterium]
MTSSRSNDTFGHDAGDVLLARTGKVLQTGIRGGDIACRYGGEEFMIIMPEASLEIAVKRAEALRVAIKELSVHHNGRSLGCLSISAGVAVYPEHGSTMGALLESADRALYRAKQAGRDQVVDAGAS